MNINFQTGLALCCVFVIRLCESDHYLFNVMLTYTDKECLMGKFDTQVLSVNNTESGTAELTLHYITLLQNVTV